MCGIAGIFAYHYAANNVDSAELLRIRDYLSPLSCGETWISEDQRVSLACQQLAKKQTSASQLAFSADGKMVLVLEGEIYNSDELCGELDPDSRSFPSTSSAELLLRLYVDEGDLFIKRLKGMFSFAIWDSARSAMLLGRDCLGIKPLYYADDGWTVRFASRVKALVAGGKISNVQEPAALAAFYLYGRVPDPLTTYQEIRAVPPGSIVLVDRIGAREPKVVSSGSSLLSSRRLGSEDGGHSIKSALRAVLERAKRRFGHRVGVIALGDQKSLDLLRLLNDFEELEVWSLSLGFEGQQPQNDLAAEGTASPADSKIHHATRKISVEELRTELPKIANAMDQPSLRGVITWFLCKAAKELGLSVLISGLNIDAGFRAKTIGRSRLWKQRGNTSLRSEAGLDLRIHDGQRDQVAELLRDDLIYQRLFGERELKLLLGEDSARIGLRRLAHTAKNVSLNHFPSPDLNDLLRVNDWGGAAHGVQINVPLLELQVPLSDSSNASWAGASKDIFGSAGMPLLSRSLSETARGWAVRVVQT